MPGDCCAARPARSGWWLGSGVALGLVAVLVPKCPLCLAGWLALIGVGATVGIAVGELLAPTSVVLAALVVGAWVMVAMRAR